MKFGNYSSNTPPQFLTNHTQLHYTYISTHEYPLSLPTHPPSYRKRHLKQSQYPPAADPDFCCNVKAPPPCADTVPRSDLEEQNPCPGSQPYQDTSEAVTEGKVSLVPVACIPAARRKSLYVTVITPSPHPSHATLPPHIRRTILHTRTLKLEGVVRGLTSQTAGKGFLGRTPHTTFTLRSLTTHRDARGPPHQPSRGQ